MSLKTLTNWYAAAGIDALYAQEAINHLEAIAAERKEKATRLEHSKAQLSYDRKASKSQSFSPLKNKKDTPSGRPSVASDKPMNVYLDSDAVKRSLDFVKNIQSMAEIQEKIKDYDILPLQRTASHTLIGSGHEQADLMIVNLLPSAQDEREGQILTGQQGQLFDKIIHSIGLTRDHIYIVNNVFWRTPGDRSPTLSEIGACLPIFEKIIEYVRPRYIVAMGTKVSQILTGKNASVSKMRGQYYDFYSLLNKSHNENIKIRPIYQIDSLISSPALKADAWVDWLNIKDALKQD